ncbi:NADPH-dependent F420 reductase [Novipirellula sp.]|uniref:NADPH-dependent F420 reductase n=1 Tax=Novipirellula sp. TaxID=2795430 RepID=UPI003569A107
MKYAIIGSGAIGNAVATQFARNHQSVVIANSRGKDSLAQLSAELGSYVTACDLKDTMSADIIVLATPFEAAIEVLRQSDDWQGKIVIDATNAIAFPSFSPKDLGAHRCTVNRSRRLEPIHPTNTKRPYTMNPQITATTVQ